MRALYTYIICFVHLGLRLLDASLTSFLLSTGKFYESNPMGFGLLPIIYFLLLSLGFFLIAYYTRKDKFYNLLVFTMVLCFSVFGMIVIGWELYWMVNLWQL